MTFTNLTDLNREKEFYCMVQIYWFELIYTIDSIKELKKFSFLSLSGWSNWSSLSSHPYAKTVNLVFFCVVYFLKMTSGSVESLTWTYVIFIEN